MLLLISITSPLTYDRVILKAFVEACKLGIPVFVNSGPVAGATSPVTLAGTLVLNMAEFISVLVTHMWLTRTLRSSLEVR